MSESSVCMSTFHKTRFTAICPHGDTDIYEAEFKVHEGRVLLVERIAEAIAEATAKPIYQEDLTRRLAEKLECWVSTRCTHGRFNTSCYAGWSRAACAGQWGDPNSG